MADAYLRWKYGCDVDIKPTNSHPPSPSPTVDGASETNTPLPPESTGSDPNHASINGTLLNTAPTIDASTMDKPTNGAPTVTPPTNGVPTNNPSTGTSFVSPHPSGNTVGGARGDGPSLPGIDIEITIIDVYTLATSVKVSSTDEETTASALADLGFIGNAPFKPTVAVSMKTLELYRILRRRKPSLSVEAFVKVISDLYLVCLPLLATLCYV